MQTLTISNVDDRLVSRLQKRAADRDRSVEEEILEILRTVLSEPQPTVNFADKIAQRFAPFGGVELPEFPREPLREPPNFES